MREENPITLKEAIDNLNKAFREFCITAFELNNVMERMSKIINSVNSPARKRKPYHSPYAIFDKFRQKKHTKR